MTLQRSIQKVSYRNNIVVSSIFDVWSMLTSVNLLKYYKQLGFLYELHVCIRMLDHV